MSTNETTEARTHCVLFVRVPRQIERQVHDVATRDGNTISSTVHGNGTVGATTGHDNLHS